ncbi:MAG TPA: sugar phosphate nucleotidyltransferase, partial [Methanocorpusculum sp.]|nr:sugar phosphate nucleotidyltransferase [Methanocorpusculum sp.]
MTHSSVPGAVIFDMDNTLHSLHAAAQAAADAVSLFFGTEYNLHFTPLNRDRPSMPAEFREYFGDGSEFGVNITYKTQEDFLGTANAISYGEDFIEDSLLVLNGDI